MNRIHPVPLTAGLSCKANRSLIHLQLQLIEGGKSGDCHRNGRPCATVLLPIDKLCDQSVNAHSKVTFLQALNERQRAAFSIAFMQIGVS
jgi:hypothetical protein